ncbi:PEPxxWA-CTERM sorting domain-containing protein [Phenylobacterium sp.]|uniref:PEPxxWA-CTERM sorting domain-containing protein n=1 Tax=Phenylobacterium sp. TaxID=1871053 RepID=UPI0025FE533D|nr:PEPxxWA-CTERM sorting domain-containing protein [Phenylobacterium sp.]MBX3483082.1 PEPxxWA-CTERM sorting domain-containing protein [Phenylobacterium sp.]
MLATTAQAAVFISFDGVTTAYSQAGDGEFAFSAVCGGVGDPCGGFETVAVVGTAPPDLPGLLHSDSVAVNARNTGAASITIWVTRTDLTNLGDDFFSSFTSNNLGGAVQVHLDTLISSTNQLFGGATLASFDHNSTGSASSNVDTAFATGAGPYSVTQKYIITVNSSATERSASPTITLSTSSAVVPEPGAWALMILGFGGAGAMLRSHRRRTAAA